MFAFLNFGVWDFEFGLLGMGMEFGIWDFEFWCLRGLVLVFCFGNWCLVLGVWSL